MKLDKLIATVIGVTILKTSITAAFLLAILYFFGPAGLAVLGIVFLIANFAVWVAAFSGASFGQRAVVRDVNNGIFVYVRDAMFAGFLAYYGFHFLAGVAILTLVVLYFAGDHIDEAYQAKLYAVRRG